MDYIAHRFRRAVASVRAALPTEDAVADVLAFGIVLLLLFSPAILLAVGIALGPSGSAQ